MNIQTANRNYSKSVFTIVAAAVVIAGSAAASTLTLTSPPTAAPGTTLALTVVPSGSFTEVVVAGDGAMGFSKVQTGQGPYQVSLPVPANLPAGSYMLTAMGAASGTLVSSAPVTITVERLDAPVQVDAQPTSLGLAVGARMPVRVIGTYADGTKVDITRSVNTHFSSDSPSVVSVDGQGKATAVAAGAAHITVSNSLSNYSVQLPVTVSAVLAVAPVWPSLYASQSAQFNAFQPGVGSISSNWTISPAVGSISASGVYKAPSSIANQQIVYITATSKTDPTKTVTTGVGLYPPVKISLLPVVPVVLTANQTFRFVPSVLNALDSNVDWSISSKSPGTIDGTGLYKAPATIKSQTTVVVTATSIADSSKTATGTIILQPVPLTQ